MALSNLVVIVPLKSFLLDVIVVICISEVLPPVSCMAGTILAAFA